MLGDKQTKKKSIIKKKFLFRLNLCFYISNIKIVVFYYKYKSHKKLFIKREIESFSFSFEKFLKQ